MVNNLALVCIGSGDLFIKVPSDMLLQDNSIGKGFIPFESLAFLIDSCLSSSLVFTNILGNDDCYVSVDVISKV